MWFNSVVNSNNYRTFSKHLLLAAALGLSCFSSSIYAKTKAVKDNKETSVQNAKEKNSNTVLLISIDGMRADYLQLGITPNLEKLSNYGILSQSLQSSYPSLTFPNHYTIVTGLRPDRHGIINNTIKDPELGDFSLSNREAVADGRWWGGEPIWVTTEKAGLPTATMFWPGSEAEIKGIRPRQWLPFDKNMTPEQRVDQVVKWLSKPDSERPRLVTLYFDTVDSAGHENGPDSIAVSLAINEVDQAIGLIIQDLEQLKLTDKVNIIVVSDHGMAPTSPNRVVIIDDVISADVAVPVTTGQVVGFNPVAGQEKAAEDILIKRHPNFECWRKGELPEKWHYGQNARIPAIICQADEGWLLTNKSTVKRWEEKQWQGGGSHGYAPELESMQGIFIASGPDFSGPKVIPTVDNIDIYELMTHLLHIPAAENQGNLENLRPILKDN